MGVPNVKNAMWTAVNPKYRLDPEDFIKIKGRTLYRVVALRDFGDGQREVEKSERGGWIEGYHNLSQEGDCWVAGRAVVMKNARLEKNALICDSGEATDDFFGTDDILINGNGSAGGQSRMLDESQLGGKGRIEDAVELSERSRVGGGALIKGRVTLAGNVFIHGVTVVAGTQHFGGDTDLEKGTWTGGVPAKRDVVDPAALTVSGP